MPANLPFELKREETPERFLIVIAEEVARIGLKQIYFEHFRECMIETRPDVSDILFQSERASWDVILLDLHLPNRSGFGVLKDFRLQFPRAIILAYVKETTTDRGLRALNEGADGCLSVSSSAEEFVDAVHTVASGRAYVTSQLNERLVDSLTHGDKDSTRQRLSNREFEVMEYIAEGRLPKEIAGELGLSVKTISTVHTRLKRKLGVRTDAGIVRYAVRNGLVQA